MLDKGAGLFLLVLMAIATGVGMLENNRRRKHLMRGKLKVIQGGKPYQPKRGPFGK